MIESLPRREREVFEILCRLEQATTGAVRAAMSAPAEAPLSDSAVRTLLTRLEKKGLVRRSAGGEGVLFRPAPRPETVARGALTRLVDTFFAGSAATAATALLGLTERLKPEEIEALRRAIDDAEGRGQ